MTQHRPNGRPHDDPTGEWLPVADAAVRLGVTPDALRMRAKRGTVPSRKVGRRLEVLVEGPNADPKPDPTPTERTIQRETQRDDEPIDVPYRVAGESGRALVPVETMLDGMQSLGDRLAELAQRNEALAVEVGALRERAGHQEGTIGRLERERDELRAEVERRRAEEAPTPHPQPPGAAAAGAAPFVPSVAAWRERTTRAIDLDSPAAPAPWWRRWWRRTTGGP